MARKCFSLWLCIWMLTLGLLCLPAALAMPLEKPQQPSQEAPAVSVYHITLDTQVIGSGETLFYETIDPEFAGNPFAADYYPGELTVELTGQIVIEEGGCLAIGTLSSGSEEEHRPVLRGSCSPDGLIVVRSGGRLILKSVSLDLEGEGLLIVQEPGSSVVLTGMEPEPGLIAWAPPMVDNTHQQPADLWLEEGTALTEAMLPDTLGTYLQYQGTQKWKSLALQWNTAPLDSQTKGEGVLMGAFLDENGELLASVRPLTLTVHWYEPGQLILTDTAWLGQTAASATLTLKELPADAAEVWGEVSADGGETWTRWEQFQYQEEENGAACIFFLSDSTPRHFRIQAANEQEHLYWTSEAVLLPKEEIKPSDQGGNRGGSTAVIRPSRKPSEPEPTPTPTPEPTRSPTPSPSLTPTPSPTPNPTPTPSQEPTTQPSPAPASESVSTPEPMPPAEVIAPVTPATAPPKPTVSVTAEPSASPSPSAEPTATPMLSPTPTPETVPEVMPSSVPTPAPSTESGQGSPAPIVQLLLITAGAAFCALVGVYVARRKRK